jgi:hypothetical protein
MSKEFCTTSTHTVQEWEAHLAAQRRGVSLRAVLAWPYRRWVEPRLAARLVACHGRGADTQAEYYRCHGCKRLVTWLVIKAGGCGCGMSNRLSPAVLTRWEMVRLVLFPRLGLARPYPEPHAEKAIQAPEEEATV